MKLKVLHRRVLNNAERVQTVLEPVLPAKLPKRYLDRQTNLSSFISRINTAAKPLDICVDRIVNEDAPEDGFMFTGLWLPEDELPHKKRYADVRIEWHTHPTMRRVKFTPLSWQRMRFGFWSYLLHELVHRQQNIDQPERSTRVFRPISAVRSLREEQEYLGDFNEIEAYAHDAALEMVLLSPRASFLSAFGKMQKQPLDRNTAYNVYSQIFAAVPDHKAVQVFETKMYEWFMLIKEQQDFYKGLELETVWRR